MSLMRSGREGKEPIIVKSIEEIRQDWKRQRRRKGLGGDWKGRE